MGQKAQLAERIEQLKKEITGYEAQEKGKAREIELINGELEGARKLFEQKLMPVTKYNELQREAARLEGERGLLTATIAQLQGKISETQLQIIQVDHDLNSDIGKELREDDTKIAELVERRVAAEDQLKRMEIKAPQSGTIYQSNVHTVGGVIGAGDTIMLVLPREDSLKVEAKVAPQDIDQLHLGEPVRLRFSGLDRPTTPEINGIVNIIAPDTSSDQRTGQTFYNIRVAIDPKELARLGAIRLVPGMPVEVFIKTGERNVLSYLMKPLHDQITRAFREG
jgi:HlyD family secretion protein